MKTSVSYSAAMAAGQDAGNRNATKHGRAVWTAEDWDEAAKVARALLEMSEIDAATHERIKRPLAYIPKAFPVRPLTTATQRDRAKDLAQCGSCGRYWDDGKATSMTPAPSGRCPFEAYH